MDGESVSFQGIFNAINSIPEEGAHCLWVVGLASAAKQGEESKAA